MKLRWALRKKCRISWYYYTKSISRELLIRLRPQAKIISWISVITSLKYADQSQPSSPQFTWRKKHFTIDINHLKWSLLDHIIATTYRKCSIFMKIIVFKSWVRRQLSLFFPLSAHIHNSIEIKKNVTLLQFQLTVVKSEIQTVKLKNDHQKEDLWGR